MKPPIEPGMTVGALLDAYPEAERILIELAPAFDKLKNPRVRRTVAKVATLEQAAKIGGVSLPSMIQTLRTFTGQSHEAAKFEAATEAAGTIPAWVAMSRIVEEVDAAAMLERGVHPIGKIREAVGSLGPGETVLLRVPFRPEPLLDTMRRAGALVYCAPEGPSYVAYFSRAPIE